MELARLGAEQMKGSEGAGQAGQCPVTDPGYEVDFPRKEMKRRNEQGTGGWGAVGSGEVTLCCPWCGILVTMCRAPEVPLFPWTPTPTPCSADTTSHLSLSAVPAGGCPRLRGTPSLPRKVQT